MKSNTTLIRGAAILALGLGLMFPARAQYCQPTFMFGCSLWGSQTVTLSTINWSLGSQLCTDYDYTWMMANLTTGIPHLLTVTNGNWCGCAVWIDYNQDSIYDVSENQFYDYQANQNNTYSIYITVPNGTAVGQYRMRIISPWGSDGFLTTNVNGYGPCGSYQYGGFQDFTINVTGPQGMEDLAGGGASYLTASLNRERNVVDITIRDLQPEQVTLQLSDISGRVVARQKATASRESIDVSALPKGMYVLNAYDGAHWQSIKLVK